MSTSSERSVGEQYARRNAQGLVLLFRLKVRNFMHCGADVSFLSAFPEEAEFLYPPGAQAGL